MNYIKLKYDEKGRYVAQIHENGKVRTFRNPKDVEKILEISKNYDYEIEEKVEGKIKEDAEEIINDFWKYLLIKKVKREIKKPLKVIGNINENMKLTHKNPADSKKVVISSLAAMMILTSVGIYKREKIDTANQQNFQYREIIENPDESIIDDYCEEEILPEEKTEEQNTQEEITIEKNTKEENSKINIAEQLSEQIEQTITENCFHFSYEDRTNQQNIDNSRRYEDIFVKYGNQYGIDPNLLMALAAQESCGNHYDNLDNGPASGIMQIEKSVHIGTTISAYNFNTREKESIYVTAENLRDIDTNIKIGTMILRNCIEDNYYNIPLALQTYNFGPGNMYNALSMCSDLEGVSMEDMKNDPTNNIWLNYRAFLHTGDSKYVEHVFSFLENNTNLTVLTRENEPITITLINDQLETVKGI